MIKRFAGEERTSKQRDDGEVRSGDLVSNPWRKNQRRSKVRIQGTHSCAHPKRNDDDGDRQRARRLERGGERRGSCTVDEEPR